MEYVYKIHHIPTSDPILLAFLAGKYATLRLSALTSSASSFSGTFAVESLYPAEKCIEKLQRPSANTFVAVAYAKGTPAESQTIDRGDWIGSAILIGPKSKSAFEVPESGAPQAKSDNEETKWQMTAVYNTPTHRGRGIAKLLVLAALDYVDRSSGDKGSRVRIMIAPTNLLVKTMYSKLGFVDAGLFTQAEAYVANEETELFPADMGVSLPEKYYSRKALGMEKVTPPAAA